MKMMAERPSASVTSNVMMPSHPLGGAHAKSSHGETGKSGSEKKKISEHGRHPLQVMATALEQSGVKARC